MTRKKPNALSTASLVRSSAAEHLTFVAASGAGGVEAVYADENVCFSQKMMAQLYDVEVPTINYHLKKVFEDSELEQDSVIRSFRITAADRLFESDFDRVVAETKRLGEGDARATSREGKKP